MSEQAEREAVVAEVKTWIGTPYHHMGRVKRAGVDCAMLLAEVYEQVGLMPRIEPDYYPSDWMLHRDEERYLNQLMEHATEILGEPKPGDILLVRFGRCFSHGAVVIEWPTCIHALLKQNVGYVDALNDSAFKDNGGELRVFKFFTLWPETA